MNADQDRTWLVTALCLFLLALTLLVLSDAGQATKPDLAITQVPSTESPGEPAGPIELHDFDGDGAQEILAPASEHAVRVFDSRDGELLFEAETTLPSQEPTGSLAKPEAATVDRPGTDAVVVTNAGAVVTAFRYEAREDTSESFALEREWQRRLNLCHDEPTMRAKPVLADLDQDGEHEILLATREVGLYVLNHDGTLDWKRCVRGGTAPPVVTDLDRDGTLDVVFANDAGLVAAFEGREGRWLWARDVSHRHDVGSGAIPIRPAVGQIDGRAGPDIVVGVRDDRIDATDNHARLVALDHRGRSLWAYQDTGAAPHPGAVPTIADVDRNHRNEVFWADARAPVPASTAPETDGPTHLYRLDHEGTLLWKRTLDEGWSQGPVPLADLDGDDEQEVLTPATGPDDRQGIAILDAHNGGREGYVGLHPWKALRSPTVVDLWRTGTMQWLVPAEPATPGASGALLVHDTGRSLRSASPGLPDYELASPGVSKPSTATFRIDSPAEWWQEVYVDPDEPRTIADVEIRIGEGSWRAMDETRWGAWTSSFHAPEGTEVQFRAHDTHDRVTLSAAFHWLEGGLTKRNIDADTGPIDPAFRIGDQANNGWIEVFVSARAPLRVVDVRVDEGPWRALDRTAWGSWTTSTHVETGAWVQFRATSWSGTTATSPSYSWLADDFDATFQPHEDVGNDWIEVDVDAARDLRAVHIRTDDGDWHPLEETSWGTWATREGLPSGAEVEFRATSTTGERSTSPVFVLP